MTTAIKDINFKAGDTFTYDIQYLDAENTPIDLTGCSVLMQVRTLATSTTIEETATGGIVDAVNGSMTFTLSKTQTQNLLPVAEASKQYVYDVEVTFADTTVFTIVEGKVSVSQSVTRP